MANSLEHIRSNPKMYLGNVEPDSICLATRLAESALRCAARLVEMRVLDEGWIAVSGESDWITPSAQKTRKDTSLERVFTGLMPQEGGIPNELRFEPIVTAFSRSLAVKSDGHWTLIAGALPSNEVQQILANSRFAVAFQALPHSLVVGLASP
jgi:hypothetical protein